MNEILEFIKACPDVTSFYVCHDCGDRVINFSSDVAAAEWYKRTRFKLPAELRNSVTWRRVGCQVVYHSAECEQLTVHTVATDNPYA